MDFGECGNDEEMRSEGVRLIGKGKYVGKLKRELKK
jgi:hypothetical protein